MRCTVWMTPPSWSSYTKRRSIRRCCGMILDGLEGVGSDSRSAFFWVRSGSRRIESAWHLSVLPVIEHESEGGVNLAVDDIAGAVQARDEDGLFVLVVPYAHEHVFAVSGSND